MCFLIAEIGMFVFGLLALIKGEFTLSAARIVRGVAARIIGVVLVLPLFLALVILPFLLLIRAGPGQQPAQQELEKVSRLEPPIMAVCLLTALGIAVVTARQLPQELVRNGEKGSETEDLPPPS